jgi:hypothetical protein
MALPTTRLSAGVITGLVVGRSYLVFMARILGLNVTPITQASVSSIAYQASDLTAGTVLGTGSINVATVQNALVQNDPRWTRDSMYSPGPDGQWGYNWIATLATFQPAMTLQPNVYLAQADLFQVDFAFSMADLSTLCVAYRWRPEQSFI